MSLYDGPYGMGLYDGPYDVGPYDCPYDMGPYDGPYNMGLNDLSVISTILNSLYLKLCIVVPFSKITQFYIQKYFIRVPQTKNLLVRP